MKHSKLYLVLIAILCAFIGIFTACSPNRTDSGNSGSNDSGNVNPPSGGTRIQMTFDGQTIYGTLDDNSVSRDLISRLPLTLDFSDYNGTEKIAYLPEGSAPWDTSDAPTSCAPKESDITMYSPWGNLAIFYHSFRQSNGLIPLGRLDDGEIDKLAAMSGSFSVTIALVEQPDKPNVPDQPDIPDKPDVPEQPEQPEQPDNPNTPEIPEENNVLVVYFSYSGNTKTIAEMIAEKSGATLVEIIAQIPYTAADTNYNDSSSRSQVERRNDARPEISTATYSAINMDEYSVVMIGYPIWNGYEPMIIRTFIEHYNGLAGKTVYTFSTSASSGGSTAFNSIKGRLPSSDVKENLHFTRSSLSSAESTVEEKLTEWNLLKQSNETMRMKMSFNGQAIFVTLADNSATADLIARLKVAPITIEFSDFGGSEKIGYPSPALDVSNADGCDPVVGDLTIYTPWGNLAAFYKDTAGYSDSLVLIGKIEDNGIEILAAQSGTFTVTLELVV